MPIAAIAVSFRQIVITKIKSLPTLLTINKTKEENTDITANPHNSKLTTRKKITNKIQQLLRKKDKPKTPTSSKNQTKKISALLTNWKFAKPSPADEKVVEQVDSKLDSLEKGKIKNLFHKILQQVQPQDIEKINQNLDKMQRGAIKQIWTQVQGLWKLAKDPQAAWKSKAIAIASLVYLISPFDVIPDFLPIAGLADDAALIIAVASSFAVELEKYLTRQAEIQADIQIKKYNRIVRIALIGSISSAIIAIIVKLIMNQL